MRARTEIRETPKGLVAIRGQRELHLLATSPEDVEAARTYLRAFSFDRLFKAGRSCGLGRNVRALRMRGAR